MTENTLKKLTDKGYNGLRLRLPFCVNAIRIITSEMTKSKRFVLY